MRRYMEVRRIPVPRLKDRSNPMEDFDGVRFKNRFHMTKDTVKVIYDMIHADLVTPLTPISRSTDIPPLLQFLAVLRFYATGTFQIAVGDLIQISQSTVSKLVCRISKLVAQHAKEHIRFPTVAEARDIRRKFYEIGEFPG